LGRATGGCHVAAFCSVNGEILCAHEDVGRHNALDKLVGALALSGRAASSGFVLLSARCSYELVEKTVRAGFSLLVTISVPTSLAVERARASGLTLISLARRDSAWCSTIHMEAFVEKRWASSSLEDGQAALDPIRRRLSFSVALC
jgi:FdhD protein